ncbi:MAG: phospholipase/Carboxylesterase [Bacteroidota bacterium]|jgi:hypothetical protein|nr:phospholipase/Carboxylesterase [Bacteroidota bacterium]
MKKVILNAALLAAVLITGCKKDDVTAPEVTLIGNETQTISLQGTYVEQGATASDNKDGSISPTTEGSVDVNHTGTYTITYTATDAAGNTGTATRTVIVKNDADNMNGTYTCTIQGSPNYVYTQTITASPTVNKRITFSKFGDYAGNTGIYADVIGSSINLPSQTAVAVGSPATNRTFAGTGAIASSTTFGLNYTEMTSAGTINTVETFVKN